MNVKVSFNDRGSHLKTNRQGQVKVSSFKIKEALDVMGREMSPHRERKEESVNYL